MVIRFWSIGILPEDKRGESAPNRNCKAFVNYFEIILNAEKQNISPFY